MSDTLQPIPTIRELYPDLTEDDLHEAEVNLERYVKLVLRIYERCEAEHVDEVMDSAVS